jgi:hypothetical protein
MMSRMWLPRFGIPALAIVVLVGCASVGPVDAPASVVAPSAPDCRVAPATGDVAALLSDAGDLFIDTNLQALPDGDVLLFATHIDRPDDLDDAVYTIRLYRSRDGGVVWSRGEPVISDRRGRHLEDTRSVHLGGGSVLLAYESEKAAAGGC